MSGKLLAFNSKSHPKSLDRFLGYSNTNPHIPVKFLNMVSQFVDLQDDFDFTPLYKSIVVNSE